MTLPDRPRRAIGIERREHATSRELFRPSDRDDVRDVVWLAARVDGLASVSPRWPGIGSRRASATRL